MAKPEKYEYSYKKSFDSTIMIQEIFLYYI